MEITKAYRSKSLMERGIERMHEDGWKELSSEYVSYTKSQRIFNFLFYFGWWTPKEHKAGYHQVVFIKEPQSGDRQVGYKGSTFQGKTWKDHYHTIPDWLKVGLTSLCISLIAVIFSNSDEFQLLVLGTFGPGLLIGALVFGLEFNSGIGLPFYIFTILFWFLIGSLLGKYIKNGYVIVALWIVAQGLGVIASFMTFLGLRQLFILSQ